MTNVPDDRAAFTAGMRELADWLEAHPEVPLPTFGMHPVPDNYSMRFLRAYVYGDGGSARDVLAASARAMGRAHKTTSRDGNYLYVWREFGPIQFSVSAARDDVCERVVVGTRTVTETVRDPELVKGVPLVEVTRDEDIVEWRCAPLLDDAIGGDGNG